MWITRGTDKDYDPSTVEGAKALGLTFPIPASGTQVNPKDVVPFLVVIGAAIFWGLAVVPNFMERSDGSRTTYFAETRKMKPYEGVRSKEIEAAPLVEIKRLNDASADSAGPISTKSPSARSKGAKAKKKKARTSMG